VPVAEVYRRSRPLRADAVKRLTDESLAYRPNRWSTIAYRQINGIWLIAEQRIRDMRQYSAAGSCAFRRRLCDRRPAANKARRTPP
jgi:hypothetical protein